MTAEEEIAIISSAAENSERTQDVRNVLSAIMTVSLMPGTFGEALKATRRTNRIAFSEMGLVPGLDIVDYSKIERGILPAPRDEEIMRDILCKLRVQERSKEWYKLLDLAEKSKQIRNIS